MENIKGALGKPSGMFYGSNRDVDDLYAARHEEFEDSNPLKDSPFSKNEDEILEKPISKLDRSGDSCDSNEEQQPATLIQITDPNHFSPPPQRMQQFKGGSIDISRPAATVAQRSSEAAIKASTSSFLKSPYSEKDEPKVTVDVDREEGGTSGETPEADDVGASSGNSSPGSPDFLRKMTSWFERSKNSPTASFLRRTPVKKDTETEPTEVPIGGTQTTSSSSSTPNATSNINEASPEDASMGDIYTDRGIIGINPMLKNKSRTVEFEDSHSNASTASTINDTFKTTSSIDTTNNNNENDGKDTFNDKEANDPSSSLYATTENSTLDKNAPELKNRVALGKCENDDIESVGNFQLSLRKKIVTFVIPARPDVYVYESEGPDSPSGEWSGDDDGGNDNKLEVEQDEIVGISELHPEPENTKLNSSSMSVNDFLSGKSPIPDESTDQYSRLESPKQIRFALNVRFSDETGGTLEQFYQNPLSPSSPSSTTSSDRSKSPDIERGFESANGRLQRFKQLILQASLRKQKMIFSPSKQKTLSMRSKQGNKKGSIRIPASDTKASVMARSRRYDEIIRREEAQLSRPLAELCWDNSPANQDFRRATKANRHYWNQVRMLSANEFETTNFERDDHDEDVYDDDMNDSARASQEELYADEVKFNDASGSDPDLNSRRSCENEGFVDDGFPRNYDNTDLKDADDFNATDIERSSVADINCTNDTKKDIRTTDQLNGCTTVDVDSNNSSTLRIQTSFDSSGGIDSLNSVDYSLKDDVLDDADSELDLQVGVTGRISMSQASISSLDIDAKVLESQKSMKQAQVVHVGKPGSTPAKTKITDNLSPLTFSQQSSAGNIEGAPITPLGLDIDSALEVSPSNQTSPWTSVVFVGEDDRRRTRSSTFGSFDDGNSNNPDNNDGSVVGTSTSEEILTTSEPAEEQSDERYLNLNEGDETKICHNQESARRRVVPNKSRKQSRRLSTATNDGGKCKGGESDVMPKSQASDNTSVGEEQKTGHSTVDIPPPSKQTPKVRPVVPFNGSHFTSGLPPLRRLGQKASKIEVEHVEIDENEAKAWQPITDKGTGKTYYWNSITNETTALSAPDPNKFRIKTVSSPEVRQDSPSRTNLYHEDTSSHISPTYPYPKDMMKRREKLFDPSYTRFFNQRMANVEKSRSPISSNFRKPKRKYDYTGRVNPRSVPDFPVMPDVSRGNIGRDFSKTDLNDGYIHGSINSATISKNNISNHQTQQQQTSIKGRAPLAKSVQIKLSKTQKIMQEKRRLEAKKERQKNQPYW